MNGVENAGILGAKLLVFPRIAALSVVTAEPEMAVENRSVSLAPERVKLMHFKTNHRAIRNERQSAALYIPNGRDARGVRAGLRGSKLQQSSQAVINSRERTLHRVCLRR